MLPAATRCTELEPERPAAWNQLAYAYLGLGQHEQAVGALRRYAEVAPMEANAHDSLGDALLANNQLDEARIAYQRAVDSSGGSLWASGQGVATVCAIQGDWFCARAAIEQARRSATQPDDRLAMMEWTAWSYLADEQPGEAYRAVDELEQDAGRLGLEARVVTARLLRGRLLLTQARWSDAMKVFTVLGPQKFPSLTPEQRTAFEVKRLHGLIEAQARLRNVSEANKALAQLEKLAALAPRDPEGLDAVAHARGLISVQRKDVKGAINSFKKCSESFDTCKLHLAEAQDLAGDAAAAKKTRSLVRTANHRDPEYWWARVRATDTRADSEARAKQEDRSAF
jgi:tetratricopeptide (TPR) repeat protein